MSPSVFNFIGQSDDREALPRLSQQDFGQLGRYNPGNAQMSQQVLRNGEEGRTSQTECVRLGFEGPSYG
jgi:hypothetical protein